jgi:hypothetical protein
MHGGIVLSGPGGEAIYCGIKNYWPNIEAECITVIGAIFKSFCTAYNIRTGVKLKFIVDKTKQK